MNKIEFAGTAIENSYGKYFSENFASNGSPKDFDLERCLTNPQGNIQNIVKLAKYYYYSNGVIMRTVNLIRDFSIGELQLEYRKNKKKVSKVIDDFNERINIQQVLKDIIYELALTGNCGGYNRDGKRIDIFPVGTYEVSPLLVNNKQILFFNNELNVSDSGDDLIKQSDIEKAYPDEVRSGIRKGQNKIKLNVDNTFFIKTNSSRYEPYGITFLLPAFPELAHKNLLKQAENSSATGIIEQILLIKIGDKDNLPTSEQITYYDSLFKGKNGSLRATVPYYVDGKWVAPDTQILEDKKFVQVDKDLLSALGISLTLIRGEGGGNYSDGVLNITGLIKTIESLRSDIPTIIEDWYRQELIKNNLNPDDCPSITLPEINIDREYRTKLVQWLFQYAGLPYEVLYNETGYNFESILQIREKENDTELADTFALREQPFQGSQLGNSEAGRPKEELKNRESNPEQSNNDAPRTSNKEINMQK